MQQQTALPFDNSYARLPERFFARQLPTPVSDPGLIQINDQLAQKLGISEQWLRSAAALDSFSGNAVPAGADPISAAYAGHQFGGWNPQLGDGRAVLLGELVNPDGERFDLQLKGSGPTPWSRGGDGRSPIGPVLREYTISEAMATLGVPTTRALAAVTTGERVMRDTPQPGAILTRVAISHIRIGTFQYFAARKDSEALELLVDHVIARHYPAAAQSPNPTHAMLDAAIAAQAKLIAHWQLLGFIHGVMNTDNVLLSGETVDYGPCAYMDDFHPDTVFSSIDHNARYSYRNQPAIAHWNLSNLAQTIIPLLASDEEQAIALAQQSVDAFPALFLQANQDGLIKKLGLSEYREGDDDLMQELLTVMAAERADFTLTFRRLSDLACEGANSRDPSSAGVAALYEFSDAFTPWISQWRQRVEADAMTPQQRQSNMYRANPVFIARNHLVAEVIQAAESNGDLRPFVALNTVLQQPFHYQTELARYATPPKAEEAVTQTFCGT